MSVADDKKRITITCTEDQVLRLNMYASKMGLNRSALCTYLISEGLLLLDRKYSGGDNDLPF